jgi:hypothetical protein
MKMTAFWVMALCSLVETDRRFRGAYCNTPVTEAGRTSDISVHFYEATWRHISESCHLQTTYKWPQWTSTYNINRIIFAEERRRLSLCNVIHSPVNSILSSSILISILFRNTEFIIFPQPPAALCPGERTSGTHWIGGWVGLRAGLDTEARGNILCLYGDRSPVVQSAVRHCTDWAK